MKIYIEILDFEQKETPEAESLFCVAVSLCVFACSSSAF